MIGLTKDEYVASKLNLISQYQGSPVISGIAQAILAEIYELKNAVDDLPKGRSLEFSQGRILDLCGSVVNLQRFDPSAPDDIYRNLIYAEIFANQSRGLKSDFQNIIALVLKNVVSIKVINYGYRSFKIEISYKDDAENIIPLSTQKILKRLFGKSSSANSDLVSFLVVRANTFRFNSLPFKDSRFSEIINIQRNTEKFAVTNFRTIVSGMNPAFSLFQYGQTLRYAPAKDSANGWVIEDSTSYVRLRNYETGDYINIEFDNDKVNVGNIDLNWLSSRWLLEKSGDNFRIRSAWKQNLYLGISSDSEAGFFVKAMDLSKESDPTRFLWTIR